MTVELIVAIFAVAVLTGALSAVLGVAGGVVLIPFLVLVAGQTQHVAQGTTLLAIIPAALLATFLHHRRMTLSLRRTCLLGGGGIVGALAGANLGLSLQEQTLRSVFAIVLLAIAVYLALRRPKPGGQKGPAPAPSSAANAGEPERAGRLG